MFHRKIGISKYNFFLPCNKSNKQFVFIFILFLLAIISSNPRLTFSQKYYIRKVLQDCCVFI